MVKTNGDLLAALNKEVGDGTLVYGNSPTVLALQVDRTEEDG